MSLSTRAVPSSSSHTTHLSVDALLNTIHAAIQSGISSAIPLPQVSQVGLSGPVSVVSGESVHASKLSADWCYTYFLVLYACSQPRACTCCLAKSVSHTLSLSLCQGHDCMGSGIWYYVGLVNCSTMLVPYL